MAEINTPMTLRADNETKAKFAAICEQFPNKGAALQALISAYELENAKGTLTGSADLIDDFRAHLDSICRAYIAQLDLNASAEQRIRIETAEETSGLLKSLNVMQEKAERAKQDAKDAAAAAEQAKQDAEQTRQTASLQIADYEAKLAAADRAQLAAEETAKAKEQTAAVLADQLDDVRRQMTELRSLANQSSALQVQLDEARKKISDLTAQLKEKDNAAALAAKQTDLELQKAVLEAERNAAAKVDTLRDKLDQMRDEMDKLREQLHAALTEKDALLHEISDEKMQLL